jgi:hypothetical protein
LDQGPWVGEQRKTADKRRYEPSHFSSYQNVLSCVLLDLVSVIMAAASRPNIDDIKTVIRVVSLLYTITNAPVSHLPPAQGQGQGKSQE